MTDAELLGGRYRIERSLSSRSSQRTFLALDQQTNQRVVVKLLLFNQALSWEIFKLFEREASVLKTLTHPAIPSYLDYFEVETPAGKGFALVQSYIDAPSLADHVKSGRTFTAAELKQLARGILDVLIYLHDRSPPIVHRDIKPSNILLANRSGNAVGQVYLVDFGSVQAAVSESGTRTIVGTYGYMPPEQFGDRAVPASDLYGLGMTLIYLMAGQHPADLPQKNLRVCFEQVVSCPAELTAWLESMTEPALDQRFATAGQALKALQQKPTPLASLSKPPSSKVWVTERLDTLEVKMPPSKKMSSILLDLFLVVPVSVVIAAAGISPFLQSLYLLLTIQPFFFSLPELGIGLFALALGVSIIIESFGQTWLYLSPKGVMRKRKLFGCPSPKDSLMRIPRRRINEIRRTYPYYRNFPGGGQVYITSGLTVVAGEKTLSFGGDGSLSEAEIDWLAHKFSQWLGVPLTRVPAVSEDETSL